MKNAWAVCKRELKSYFLSPIGYIVLGIYTWISGLAFASTFIISARITQDPAGWGYEDIPDFEEYMLSPFLVVCGQIMMFIGPLITMWLVAGERSRGTMELLLTHPLRDRDIVFGKYMAALGMVVILMSSLALYLFMIGYYTDVEWAVLVFGLVAIFLMGAAFMALGLFISALVDNPITAGALTFGVWFVSYILGTIAQDDFEIPAAPESWGPGVQQAIAACTDFLLTLARELPLDAHAENMTQGVFTLADVAYYLLFSAFFLFLSFRAIEARRVGG